MIPLYIVNALAVASCAWAVWVRRDSFGSRWDAPITVGIVLYGFASALDTPWPAVAEASFPLTGKYYLLNTIGHCCYLAGNAAGLRTVFIRLLPDDEIGPFMRSIVIPAVTVAIALMAVCVVASPITSNLHAGYLYAAPLDGWLRVYFCTFFLTMTATLMLALFGAIRLSAEPPGLGPARPLMATVSIGSLACLSLLALILSDHSGLIPRLWPLTYLGTTAAAVTCAVAWRRRIADLTTPVDGPNPVEGS